MIFMMQIKTHRTDPWSNKVTELPYEHLYNLGMHQHENCASVPTFDMSCT